jgi:glycolate oxidase iron-sulfur subunit
LPEKSAELAPLERVAAELYKCNRCGFCQTRCPIYRVTGLESSVARGHSARLRFVLEKDLPFDDSLRTAISECLMCRACTAECPPAIETDRIIAAARSAYTAAGQSRLQRFVFRSLLPHRGRLRASARLLRLAQRVGIGTAAKLLALFPWFRGLAEAPRLARLPSTFLHDRVADGKLRPAADTTFFVGCGIEYALPEVGEATRRVLEATGCSLKMAANVCCGLPPYVYGDLASAATLARRNLDLLTGAGPIVTDCGSCSSFLKEYPRLFAEGSPERARAEALAARLQDVVEFLAAAELPDLRPAPAVVTYHDPCHLSRYQKLSQPARALLQRIPGIEYRELPEADWCCGGAGSYAVAHHDKSVLVLERKMRNVRATGAGIVVTACPSCIMQLRYGAARFGVPVEVLHLTQLLARALPSGASGLGAV